MLFTVTLQAQEFDGICHLSSNGAQWSGVAISQTEILTVAHPEPTENIWASFPRKTHGSNERISLKCRVIRANKIADVAIISYNCPDSWVVKTYELSDAKPDVVAIRGYVRDDAMIVQGVSVVPINATGDGFSLITLNTPAIHGMSGSGIFSGDKIVGIQSCGSDRTYAADIKTIRKFLEGK
jgi:hypothetical protein